ncbi:MAG: hypothetical protein NC823_03005, partial [Candidatus Omnitrophica bacterium]|nr:hypothetical protein [Candidatus Omnitrophota bacterium]
RWADIDFGKCTLMYHGGDPRVSPFIPKALPGYSFDVMAQKISEECAYKFCWPMSTGRWRKSAEFPSGYIIEGHYYIQFWGQGGLGIGCSRGCMRSCFNYLEKRGVIQQRFKTGSFIKRPRWLLDKTGQPLPPEENS